MTQAKIKERSKFLNNFVVRKSEHKTGWHILDPNEFEVTCMIIHVHTAEFAGGGVTDVTNRLKV